MKFRLELDPNPCHRYPWRKLCAWTYSRSHACRLGQGHAGACVCAACDEAAGDPGRAPDIIQTTKGGRR